MAQLFCPIEETFCLLVGCGCSPGCGLQALTVGTKAE